MIKTRDSSASHRILTYGTFDLLHHGHIRLLERLHSLGSWLAVGLSTDEFNRMKGKAASQSYDDRRSALLSSGLVDFVFPEKNWTQKPLDIALYNVSIFAMGDDWAGVFDDEIRSSGAEVLYLPRTPGIDSSSLRAARERGKA